MDELNPLAIILVSSGSRGDRLLFRYPDELDAGKQYTSTYTGTLIIAQCLLTGRSDSLPV